MVVTSRLVGVTTETKIQQVEKELFAIATLGKEFSKAMSMLSVKEAELEKSIGIFGGILTKGSSQ